ncbi:type II toxin-antitoxin system RelE/ParE family toxin [Devosia sp. 2618]|uniref:type II toxin-antitoxin system RelE/ParE family toxin n=1 Tax=Devosia sp. 2618 TaxID=3156454 RepID=UPI003396B24A
MRVQISGVAERDLLNIALYIAADNPERAFSFVDELQASCRGLGDGPLRFALIPGFEKREFRRRTHGRYAIIYRVEDDVIRVVRILSSSMDLKSVLDDH